MTRKYELIGKPEDECLYRIRALTNIPRYNVFAGDLGGRVESADNLSQEGMCWITKDASAVHDSRISGNAFISGRVFVGNRAEVSGSAWVNRQVVIADDAFDGLN